MAERSGHLVDHVFPDVSVRQWVVSLPPRLHAHAGYELGGFWNVVWAVAIDVLCVALALWIASGIVMWWMLPGSRSWGWVAIAGGLVTFAILVFRL
jgi:hypothetical protein